MKATQEDAVEAMMKVAEKWHQGVFRKGGTTPYIEHPRAVVELLKRWGVKEPLTLAVAWGHDVIEDAPASQRQIAQGEVLMAGGEAVLKGIEMLTFFPSEAARENSVKKAEEKARYIEKVAKEAPQEILLVKLADRLCNTSDFLHAGLPAKAKAYLQEGSALFERPLESAFAEQVIREKAELASRIQSQLSPTDNA